MIKIDKEIHTKLESIEGNINKMISIARRRAPNSNSGEEVINLIINDLAYVTGKLNQLYITITEIVSKTIDEKD